MNPDLHAIKLWFERAVPNPTDKNRAVQLGCHFEEVAEMLVAIDDAGVAPQIAKLADWYKTRVRPGIQIDNKFINRKELLDALCDQIVTAVGVAHMFGMNISGALNEVCRSNWSKFDSDGQPIFNEHGKIAKGPGYTPPNLEPFV